MLSPGGGLDGLRGGDAGHRLVPDGFPLPGLQGVDPTRGRRCVRIVGRNAHGRDLGGLLLGLPGPGHGHLVQPGADLLHLLVNLLHPGFVRC